MNVSEEDLRPFWAQTLQEARSIPLNATVEPTAAVADTRVDNFVVEFTSWGGVRVRGWYSLPRYAPKSRLPAVLTVPGYGGEMPPAFDLPHEGYATLTLYPRGQGESKDAWPAPAGLTKLTWGLEAPDKHYYRGAYMDCVRALDFLRSREEVDAERVAMFGTSQGGGLTLATAALDDKLAAAAAHVPFLVNYPVALETATTGPYLELVEYFRTHPDEKAKGLTTLAYMDPVNLAPWIECPIILSMGQQDTTCPPATIAPVFEAITGVKALVSYPDLPHAHSVSFRRTAMEWLRLYV